MSSKHTTKHRTASAARQAGNGRRYRAAGRGVLLYFGALLLFGVGLVWLNATHRPGARPLNAQGLRVTGAGRADATRVLPAAKFANLRVREAYRIAAEIPATLNQLYCWCGCIERGMRSNLECFESEHAAQCDVCLAGAEVAWEMRQKGITDAAKIQQVLDARFAPHRT